MAVALLLTPAGGCARHRPADVLLLTVDTLRADHLGAWGYPRATSPVLDRLAAEGRAFRQAWAQWPKTGPSFASLLTATYPKDNGVVRRVGQPLPGTRLLLAERLRAAGYQTIAVVANGAVASDLGFAQGFDEYVETWKLPGFAGPQLASRAEVVTAQALRLAARLDPERPFFLWVHYLDPHHPYEAPPPWRHRFVGDEHYEPGPALPVDEDSRRRQLGAVGSGKLLDGRRESGFYVARYDGEIAYTDEMIGRLLAELERLGLRQRLLTVMTADHGESLGEHRYYFDHGRFAYQTCLHVPLIFHHPGLLEPGVDEDPVELVDVAPTILELAGVPLEAGRWMQGRSLAPRLAGERLADAYARAEAGFATDRRWQKAIRDRRYKLIFARDPADRRHYGQALVLFDLEADARETANLAAELPEVAARLAGELDRWWNLPSFPVDVDGDAAGPEPEMSAETRRHLRALGYLQ